ncbi:hypothetical protein NIES22_21160 [Calothrix brevissima NIES-22]|nr:hypothetical protein NIES22_21160 [Calothrix brevissima NIES-22]
MSYLSNRNLSLDIQQSISQAEAELLIAIQNILDNKSFDNELEESYLRNLLKVSETTESTEVIKNFLRYQVGRDRKLSREADCAYTKIIHDIDGKIQDLAKKIAQENQTDNVNSIWLYLIRRYLGYGLNYLKFINSSHLNKIEESISLLSREEQLWLVDRIIHNLKINTFKELTNIQLESIEQQLANMANDPEVQAELIVINQEFANTEFDGLNE